MERNIELDAMLLMAAMHGGKEKAVEFCAKFGMSEEDVIDRAKWLQHKPKAYRKEVADKILELEEKERAISNSG